jgi:hypothetical protein
VSAQNHSSGKYKGVDDDDDGDNNNNNNNSILLNLGHDLGVLH